MGIDYSYECLSAKIVERLGQFDDKVVLLCDLEFEDEHGHALAPVKNAVVVLESNSADIESYAENFLSDTAFADEDVYHRFAALCEAGDPGYHVYNPEDLAKMLNNQLAPG